MRNKLVILLCIIGLSSQAQPYLELISLHAANEPTSTLYKGEDEAHIKNTWNLANLNAPIIIDKRNIIVFSPGYENRTFSQGQSDTRIYTLYFPLTYEHTFKDTMNKLSGTLIYRYNSTNKINPGIKNDMLGGAILFTHICNPKFDWKAGIYYNKEFYGDYFLPLVGFDWQASDRLFIWGLLPSSATVDYTVTNNFHAGFNFYAAEESYLTEGKNAYFHFLEVQLRLFADYYIPKTPLALTLEVGHTMMRKYESHDDNSSPQDFILKPTESAVLRAGIAWRFTTNNAFKTQRALTH